MIKEKFTAYGESKILDQFEDIAMQWAMEQVYNHFNKSHLDLTKDEIEEVKAEGELLYGYNETLGLMMLELVTEWEEAQDEEE